MKQSICAMLAAAMLLPVTVFAQQTNGPVTRAQVQDELRQLEAVGYRPSTHDGDYPQAIMKAEAKLASMHAANTAYGGVQSDHRESGSPETE
jgi:hypothetical protein